MFHPDKRGVLEENTPPILKRIGHDPSLFIQCAGDFMHVFGLTVGSPDVMAACCARRQVKFLRGIKAWSKLCDRHLVCERLILTLVLEPFISPVRCCSLKSQRITISSKYHFFVKLQSCF